jgi:hypothetical protein
MNVASVWCAYVTHLLLRAIEHIFTMPMECSTLQQTRLRWRTEFIEVTSPLNACSVVVGGPVLEAGTSLFLFPMRSFNFFRSPNPYSSTMTLGATQILTEFFLIPFYLQTVRVHSANGVTREACRGALSSTSPNLTGSKPCVSVEKMTYWLNLKY